MKTKLFNGLLGFALVLLLWQLGSMALQKSFLPTPWVSFTAFLQCFFHEEMGRHFCISAFRILSSILLATALAVPLGLAMGRIPWLGRLLNPVVYLLYPLPKVVFLPIIVVLMGKLAQNFSHCAGGVFSDYRGHPRRCQQYSRSQLAVHALAECHAMANLFSSHLSQLSAADSHFAAHHAGDSHCHPVLCRNLRFL